MGHRLVVPRGTVRRQLGRARGHAHFSGTSASAERSRELGAAAWRRCVSHGLATDACEPEQRRVYKLSAGRPCARGAPRFVGELRLKKVFASFPCRVRRMNQSFFSGLFPCLRDQQLHVCCLAY
eukprot:358816-Chlamydomonas_euryale.AAC.3